MRDYRKGSAARHRSLMVVGWLLVVGCCWLLVVGCWLLLVMVMVIIIGDSNGLTTF